MQALLCLHALLLAPGAEAGALSVLQSNDVDPTTPSSQPGGRWYHWIGTDAAVTHLETGLAIDAGRHAGRGQRIAVAADAPAVAVQIKLKRIGNPGALRWEAGTAWGKDDLGKGEIPADSVRRTYEHFVTARIKPVRAREIFLRLRARSGECPDDYYAVYCTWRKSHGERATVRSYAGVHRVGMMYRLMRDDPSGEALGADGRPMAEGPSMMTRLLTTQPGMGRRQLLDDEEEPFAFVEALAAGRDPRHFGLPWPGLKPQEGEIALRNGWQIRVAAPRSRQVETAVADLRGFLARRMGVAMEVVWGASDAGAPRSIVVTQSPSLADGPRRPAGYRFVAGEDRVRIHGFDSRGVLRGIWYLEDLLMLRGGPFLKPDARTREPRYSPRMTCSAWGGMGELATSAPVYTDEHLSLISHYGYDAIWLCWCPGPERTKMLPTHIAPGRTPDGTSYQPFTARLRDLAERAEKYDLEVVLQYAAPHPRDDAQRSTLQEHARQLLRDVPKLRTIVLLDEGMGSVRKGVNAWVETCSLLASAFYEVRPDINVVAWVYTFHAPSHSEARWDKWIERFLRIDRRVGFMANFDSFRAQRLDGHVQRAYDYSISLKAPSEDYKHAARALLAEAKRDGKPPRRLWAKIETRFSQESNTQPEIPCMQRWVQRYRAVNDFGPPQIAGIFGNWYHQGFFPTPVTELFGWMSYTNPPPPQELLRAMARRDFGPRQADAVLAAWQDFSDAIWHYPFYYGLSYTMNAGCAQPFWANPQAKNPRPWRRGFVNSCRTMNLTASGDGPGSGKENRARFAKMHARWSAGLEKLAVATHRAPGYVRERAESHWRTARSFGDKLDVTARLVRWFDARDSLYAAEDEPAALAALAQMEKVGREELAAARRALPMYLRDSRLGHLNHGRGCFTPATIEWKIGLLEKTLEEGIPGLRAAARNAQPPRGSLSQDALMRDWQVRAAGKASHEFRNGVLILRSPDTRSGTMLASRRALKLPLRLSFAVGSAAACQGGHVCVTSAAARPAPSAEVNRHRLTYVVFRPDGWYYRSGPGQIAAEGKWRDPPTLRAGGTPHKFALTLTRTEATLAVDGKVAFRGTVSLPESVHVFVTPDPYTSHHRGTLYVYDLEAATRH